MGTVEESRLDKAEDTLRTVSALLKEYRIDSSNLDTPTVNIVNQSLIEIDEYFRKARGDES